MIPGTDQDSQVDKASRTLVVVKSPLQLLNAGEAIDALGLDVDHTRLVVLQQPEPAARRQLQAVLAHRQWPATTIVEPRQLTPWWRKYRWLQASSRPRLQFARVVIGEYRLTLLRHLVHRLRPAEVVLLDDGNGTLLLAEHRRDGTSARRGLPAVEPRLTGVPQSRLRRALHGVVRLDARPLDALTYFTIYDLPGSGHDRVVRHTYAHLRARFATPAVSDRAVFVGSSFAETGIMTVDAYLDVVRAATEQAGTSLEYLPHRREEPAKLARIERGLGLRVVTPEAPLELAFLQAGTVPATVYGVLSTALDTLAVLFGERISLRALRPPAQALNPTVAREVGRLYDRWEAASQVEVRSLR